jgi:phasin family protein
MSIKPQHAIAHHSLILQDTQAAPIDDSRVNEPLVLATAQDAATGSMRAVPALAELNGWAGRYFAAVKQLMELNSRAIHTTLDEQRAITLQAVEERSVFDMWCLQISYSLAGTAKAAAYMRHVSDIVLGAYSEAVTEVETFFNRGFTSMTAPVDSSASRALSPLIKFASAPTDSAHETAQIVNSEGKAVSWRRAT